MGEGLKVGELEGICFAKNMEVHFSLTLEEMVFFLLKIGRNGL